MWYLAYRYSFLTTICLYKYKRSLMNSVFDLTNVFFLDSQIFQNYGIKKVNRAAKLRRAGEGGGQRQVRAAHDV
jgi:hypothetical protein